MKVRHDNGPKRARPFVRKNSGSLIIHENVSIFRAKIEVFDCFLGFGWSDWSDIAYVDSVKWSS